MTLTNRLASLSLAGGVIGAMCVALAMSAEPEGQPAGEPAPKQPAAEQPATEQPGEAAEAAQAAEQAKPLSVEAARERAKLMHEMYHATLHVMHDHYFHDSRAVVPARALEDVFEELAFSRKVEAKWISVNTRAMSLRHEPASEFEKKAAEEIGAGRKEYERVEDGYYERAAAIPLTAGCINCHVGFFKQPPKSPRFAGLVIRMRVSGE
ncbi:MAG TPA: DUF3365 domain-containing protein [Pirellulales bacterium]|nr:DUF3365 domain-containing protein [Pirellulales bacterium]